MTSDSSHLRLGVLGIAALSLFGALFARLWFLQIVSGSQYQAVVAATSERTVIIPAPRGRILDRNGVELVVNRASVVVSIDSQKLDKLKAGPRARLLDRLATEISRSAPAKPKVTVKFLQRRLNDQRFSHLRPVPVVEDAPEELEIFLRERADEFPTVLAERQTVRAYPYGSLAAHVIGYVGSLSDKDWARLKNHNLIDKPYVQTDEIGKSGVEASYEKYLRGRPGRIVYEVDAAGRAVREVASKRVAPQPGDDVYLSVDAKIQYKTEEALQVSLARARGTKSRNGYRLDANAGGSVVIDPRNGQVLAMASFPTYNPADLVGGISQDLWTRLTDPKAKVLTNRAIQDAFPPGSTFKLATSYAALKLGFITPDTVIGDPGYYAIPGCTGPPAGCRKNSPSLKSGGLGNVNLATALTKSSDVYFYKLGNDIWAAHKNGQLPEDAMQQQIGALGYGTRSGIDLPGEIPGRLPTPKWLAEFSRTLNKNNPKLAAEAGRWGSGQNIDLAIGQGNMLATPLQIANAYAAFANGGRLMEPRVVSKITAYNQPKVTRVLPPTKLLRTIDWGPARPAMLSGFEGVTQPGTGGTASRVFQNFDLGAFPVAGKTGTAQNGKDPVTNLPKEDNSLFVGFAPAGDAQYVAMSMLQFAGAGAEAAAPSVRMIFEPIADGSLATFKIPDGGVIDANGVAQLVAGHIPLGQGGTD
ncbi:MAG: Penicillin-binding protein 2 [Acidimicrobiales bacterium]|nr:Penicillin-binding protein 2 [Acidimicrobiales bacterium]